MRKLIVTVAAAFLLLAPLTAQNFETGYFLGGNPYAFRLNPAFQSERNLISIGLGMHGVSALSNLGASTFFYPEDDRLYFFMNDHVLPSTFLPKLCKINYLDVDAQVNLLTVGFWAHRNFFTVDVNVRSMNAVSLPYDLFRLVKGDKTEGDVFECSHTGLRSLSFAEAAFGWSRNFDNIFSVGARAKFLVGAEAAELMLQKMKVTIHANSWSVESQGQLIASSPALQVSLYEDSGNVNLSSFAFDGSKAAPSGWGGAVDFGFSWNILPILTLSGAILDLGTIRWSHDFAFATQEGAYEWCPDATNTGAQDLAAEVDRLLSSASNMLRWTVIADARPTFEPMPFRVHLGAEFRMPFYERLSAGLLYQGRFLDAFARHTGRFSVNWNPLDFLSLSTSATLTRLGESLGFALNLHPDAVNLILGCDYIPLRVMDANRLFGTTNSRWAILPRDQMKLNFYLGLNIAFGRRRLDHAKRFI
jgi:hypothetical protein